MNQHSGSARAKKVLFVDDEALWLTTVKETVQDSSVKIITADSGEAALRKLERSTPDLILSDVRMPVMNGFDLFERVKRNPKWKDVPYVFMSSFDDFDARHTAKVLGADDYVEKPIDTEQVRTIVLNLLTRFGTGK
jgi:YesN/AraC family two-component response regulator